MTPALSVVIPSYRGVELLRRCLPSVLDAARACAAEVEVVVVDDGSGPGDGSIAVLTEDFPSVRAIALESNRGYPGAVNAGIEASSGAWVMTLNNDTTVDPGVFDALLAATGDPSVGVLAAQQRFSQDRETLYSAGLTLDRAAQIADRLMGSPVAASEAAPVDVFGATGSAAVYRRSVLDELGGFDERFRFGLEDADVAWRARMRGLRCLYVPAAVVYHDLGGTIAHGSPVRLYQAGRNRWLLIAKNLDSAQLRRQLPWIVAFDLGYVIYALVRFRTLEPLRGRIAGLSMWRGVRQEAAGRRVPVELSAAPPLRAALARRRLWRQGAGRRVLVLNQYAPPEGSSTGQMAFEIAAALAAGGDPVTFLAGQPSYQPDAERVARRDRRRGVDTVRLPLLGPGGRTTMLSRILGYAGYLLGVLTAGTWLVRRRRVEVVIAFHNPPLLPLVASLIAGRRRLIAVVQDIHPDVVVATGWRSLPPVLVGFWDRLNRWALRRAERVVVLSEEMRAALVAKGIDARRVLVIGVWAEPELVSCSGDPASVAATRSRLGLADGELLLLLAGNFGIAQQLEPVAVAAELLEGEDVRFCFVGSGVHFDQWRTRLDQLDNTTFLPYQSDSGYRELVCAADAAIVTLAPGLERLLVPSRAFPPLSAGVPLLAVMSGDSEIGRLVTAYGAGVCTLDAADLVFTVRDWIADPDALQRASAGAAAAYAATGGRAGRTARYVELVDA